jgi:D-3-phosphoglycerate dehydrogenase
MREPVDLGAFRVVRLNAQISAVDQFERRLYSDYGLNPVLVEANGVEELIPALEGCDGVLVVSTALPKAVINSLTKCRVISRLGIGTDKIDVEAARQAGILVTNVPGVFAEEMADHTMAFILALARKFPQMDRAMREGAWGRSRQLSLSNRRLSTSTLGLVGFGDSARDVACRARAFGMRILATRRRLDEPSSEAEALGVRLVDLDTLLREADYVSLHLPLNQDTYHLIGSAVLEKMKPGACLINTARGAIVDEAALVIALRSGHLGGAGLDTFEGIDPFSGNETPPNHPLLGFENVILTPHVSALSVEGSQAVTLGGLENLAAVLSGRWPKAGHVVNTGVEPRSPLEEYDEAHEN